MSANDWMTLLEDLLLPPGLLILLGLLFWISGRFRWRWLSRFWLAAVLMTWLLSTQWVSLWLMDVLQKQFPALVDRPVGADVVVVLGGGKDSGQNEYGRGSKPSAYSLERLMYGAHLARQWELPLIFSEISTWEEGLKGVDSTLAFMTDNLSVPEAYLETESETTFENARYTQLLMQSRGYQHAVVVTHYYHMPRAYESFRYFGINVTAAPTGKMTLPWRKQKFWYWVPDAWNLAVSAKALHEFGGLYWYRFKLFSNGVPRH